MCPLISAISVFPCLHQKSSIAVWMANETNVLTSTNTKYWLSVKNSIKNQLHLAPDFRWFVASPTFRRTHTAKRIVQMTCGAIRFRNAREHWTATMRAYDWNPHNQWAMCAARECDLIACNQRNVSMRPSDHKSLMNFIFQFTGGGTPKKQPTPHTILHRPIEILNGN